MCPSKFKARKQGYTLQPCSQAGITVADLEMKIIIYNNYYSNKMYSLIPNMFWR